MTLKIFWVNILTFQKISIFDVVSNHPVGSWWNLHIMHFSHHLPWFPYLFMPKKKLIFKRKHRSALVSVVTKLGCFYVVFAIDIYKHICTCSYTHNYCLLAFDFFCFFEDVNFPINFLLLFVFFLLCWCCLLCCIYNCAKYSWHVFAHFSHTKINI